MVTVHLGFGQLYNRDYINGLVCCPEFWINVQAKLNLAILFSFRGQIDVANQIADIQWLLFTFAFILIRCGRHIIELANLPTPCRGKKLSSVVITTLYWRPWAVLWELYI